MPLPPGFGVPLSTPVLISLENKGPGTYVSGPIVDPPSIFNVTDIEMWLHVSDAWSSAVVNCHVESSLDGITWTTIPGSSGPALTDAGSVGVTVGAPVSAWLQASVTVTGPSTALVTARVTALLTARGDA